MMHEKSVPGAARATPGYGSSDARQALAWLAGGAFLACWCFACLAWQVQLANGPQALPVTSGGYIWALLSRRPRFGVDMLQTRIPVTTVPTTSKAPSDRNRRVTVEISGLRLFLAPNGRYLAVSWRRQLKGSALHGLQLTWSGPLADWPALKGYPKLRWRVFHGSLLTRVPRAPGLLRIAGGGTRSLPYAYVIMNSNLPFFSWFRPVGYSAWQWAMAAFGVARSRRAVGTRCTKILLLAGAAPWIARTRSHAAVAAVDRMADGRIFHIALGSGIRSTKAPPIERLVAQELIWGEFNLIPRSGVAVCRLRRGELYFYHELYRGNVNPLHGDTQWCWVLFGSDGNGLASGNAILPGQLGLRGVATRIIGAAGLASGVPDALSPHPPARPSSGGSAGVPGQ